MVRVHQVGEEPLAQERWRFAGELGRPTRSAGRRTVELSMQGAVDWRLADCRGRDGERVVKACPGCGSMERRDFRKNGSYRQRLMTSEGPIEVRVGRLRCAVGRASP